MNQDNIEKQPPVPPFVRFVCSAVPMVFDDSLSYYEALSALWKYMQDTVDVINNNATVTEEYIQLTKDLQDYMNNYFDNLDVQEEINNKLDALVDDGTLGELLEPILEDYVNPIIEEQNSQLSDFNTRLVNQNSDIIATNARIDNIASLTEGSTTGDAELLDIRVGYDGITYDSAGDAVRHGDKVSADNIFESSYLVFTQGSLNASTGVETSSSTRIRTDVLDQNIYKVQPLDGYNVGIYLYDRETDEYVGVWNGTDIGSTLVFINKTVYLNEFQNIYKIRVLGGKPNYNQSISPSESNKFAFYKSMPLDNKIQIEKFKTASYDDFNLGFVQGSIDASTGVETTRNDRCRSVMMPNFSTRISVSNGYRFMLYGYDSDGQFLGAYNPNTSSFAHSTYVFVNDLDLTTIPNYPNYTYRIIACPPINVATITPDQANTNISCEYNIIKQDHEYITNIHENYTETIREQTSCVIDNYTSLAQTTDTGCCIVTHEGSTELWTFTTSNDDGSNYGACDKYTYNIETGELTYIGQIQHNLGHVNSVSYCEDTDTLICGNGSGDYDLAGKIYLIEGAYSKASLLRSDAIAIDFEDYGSKVNAVWGDFNFDQNDIAYVLTNDSHDIYKIQLGKFANDLGSGTIIGGATQFNGTYQILNHYEWGSSKVDYPSVVQGATFCCNKLVWGYGHNMGRVAFRYAKLNTDNTAEFGGVNYRGYSHTGEPSQWYPCGVSTAGDKLIVTASGTVNVVDLEKSI